MYRWCHHIYRHLDNLRQLGTRAWVGFSFPWAASLEARAGRGDLAEKYLSIFAEAFVSPNGFNLNGDQSGKGYSGFRYRPFTLDASAATLTSLESPTASPKLIFFLLNKHRTRAFSL